MSREQELVRIASLEKELDALKKIIVSGEDKSKQYEDKFLELMNQGLTIKINKDNGTITYYNSKGEWVAQQELKTKNIWFSYYRFWVVFESKFGLNYNEIKSLLTGLVETHLDLKGYTPGLQFELCGDWGRDTP